TVPWFDLVVHACGGITVGFLAIWIDTPLQDEFASRFSLSSFIMVIGASLFVGLLWEFFEYSFGVTFISSVNYVPDTLGDLGMDIIGGLLSLAYVGLKK
ncbi:MAG: hypothetical protein PHV42_03845, partial [Candidatus Pacebacteria bacterium]|nr:hypothetical protein [Candidatus Paceibacterota bacterium]